MEMGSSVEDVLSLNKCVTAMSNFLQAIGYMSYELRSQDKYAAVSKGF